MALRHVNIKKVIFYPLGYLRKLTVTKLLLRIGFSVLAALAVICLFSFLFFINREGFSYADPRNIHASAAFLNQFFSSTCPRAEKWNSHFMTRIDMGCEYHYIRVPEIAGTSLYLQNDIGLIYRFIFHSYEDHKLQIKFFRQAASLPDKYLDEKSSGMLMLDLSNYKKVGDFILIRITPYISYDDFLLKPSEEQSSFDFKKPPKRVTWGEILGLGLMGLGKPGTPSMTINREQPWWKQESNNELLLDLKRFFENGSMKHSTFNEFLTYSAQVFTASSSGQIVPERLAMRILVSLESLLSIVFLGLVISMVYDFKNEYKKDVT